MRPQFHIILGLVFIIILKFFASFTSMQLLIIFASSVLIDVDHWFIYSLKKKDISVLRAYKWFVALEESNKKIKFLFIFHTIEFFLLICFLSFYYNFIYYSLIGISFHYICDFIRDFKEKYSRKNFSIIDYFLTKK